MPKPLEVEIHPDLPQPYLVMSEAGPVRAYDSLAAAWDHAIWVPLNAAKLMPLVGPGGWFPTVHSRGRRTFYGDDPRYAQTIPAEEATTEQVSAARKAAARFIQRKLQANPLEDHTLSEIQSEHNPEDYETDLVSLTDDETHAAAEQAALAAEADAEPESTPENREDAAQEPASSETDDDSADPLDAFRETLNDSDRQAFDNYRHMAENADTESARAFWSEMLTEFAGVPF